MQKNQNGFISEARKYGTVQQHNRRDTIVFSWSLIKKKKKGGRNHTKKQAGAKKNSVITDNL